MTPLWTSRDAVAATGGDCDCDWEASGVSIDTRSIEPGDLFVALSDQRDGHEFVAQALEKGAAGALVSRVPDGVAPDAPLLIVPDVLEGLENLARARRAACRARIIAVTGSVGKTSTKDMLQIILAGQGRTHAAEKSYNNQWGVPLTLVRMPLDAEFAVFEIGMNHPGEIAPLAAMVRPHVALVTNVAAVHLEAFADVAAIAREKSAIFDGLENGGKAIINSDLDQTEILREAARAKSAKLVQFGAGTSANLRLVDTQLTRDATIINAEFDDAPLLVKIAAPGRHFAMNALAALAGAQALGADLAIAALDLGKWQPPAGRGTRETVMLDVVHDHLTITLINDAFNANPLSMAAALDVLAASDPGQRANGHATGRRIAILGDMLELGSDEKQLHRDIANLAAMADIELVHCVGPLMAELHKSLPETKRGLWLQTADEMTAAVAGLLHAGDVVLVKGSKGIWVSRVVDAIRKLGQVPDQQAKGTI